ncbi:MAG: hypothetical protein ACR2LN_04995 [Candidatus Levyibacteriota bacterium]
MPEDALAGKTGVVALTIIPWQMGEVSISIDGTQTSVLSYGADPEAEIPIGTQIIFTRRISVIIIEVDTLGGDTLPSS